MGGACRRYRLFIRDAAFRGTTHGQRLFGIEKFGSVFGMVFTAFGFVSGALGPWLSGFLLDITHENFTLVFFYLGVLLLSPALLDLISSSRTECRF